MQLYIFPYAEHVRKLTDNRIYLGYHGKSIKNFYMVWKYKSCFLQTENCLQALVG